MTFEDPFQTKLLYDKYQSYFIKAAKSWLFFWNLPQAPESQPTVVTAKTS